MANRSFIQPLGYLVKRVVTLFADFTCTEVTPYVVLNKWNYGTFNAGPTIRTYTAAATTPVPASSSGNFPGQYAVGTEGVALVTRTGTGLWTLRLQDNYCRSALQLSFFVAAAAGASAVARVNENTTISNYAAQGGSLIGLAWLDYAGAAVDPIGEVRLTITLGDASEG